MPFSHRLDVIARAMPDHTAQVFGDEQLTYAELDELAARLAGGLVARFRLRPGDRIGIAMENGPHFYPALYACWRAGLAAVPINPKLHAKELAWILDNAGVKVAVLSSAIADQLSEAPGIAWPEIVVAGSAAWQQLSTSAPAALAFARPDAPAWLFYTSGTTGRPKGAILTHRSLLFMCQAYYADIDFIGPGDTFAHAAPLSHGSGLYGLAHIAQGGTQVILPGFDLAALLEVFATHRNVSMFAAPTMLVRLVDSQRLASADLSGLKTICYGGAPMYVADIERALARLGPRLYQLYGQGEAPMTITGLSKALHADRDHPDFASRIASVGIARTGVAFRILDEIGREVPRGEVGEIVVAGDGLMAGYHANDEANARALREGWLWTGDMGAIDDKGFLTLKDRSKDLIISGGSNIYPREIEEVLLRHPAVQECAVVGSAHTEWGEEAVAFIVVRPGALVSEAELDQLCLANIARFKRPKSYRFVESLPKNNYGKVLKTELRLSLGSR